MCLLKSKNFILDYSKESPSSSHHRRESLSNSSQGYKSSKSESKPIRDGAIKGRNRSRFFVRVGHSNQYTTLNTDQNYTFFFLPLTKIKNRIDKNLGTFLENKVL